MKVNIVSIRMNRQLIALAQKTARDRAPLVRALLPALPWATDHERPAIAELLLRSGDPTAIAAVLRERARLGAWLDDALPRIPDRTLLPAVDSVAARSNKQAAEMAALMRDHPRPAFAPVLLRIMQRSVGLPRTQIVCAEALLQATQRHIGPKGCAQRESAGRAALEKTIIALLQQYADHRQEHVAVAGLLLALRPGRDLAELLADIEQNRDAHADLLRDLRRGVNDLDRVEVASHLLHWLNIPALAQQCAQKLCQVRTAAQWIAVLRNSHVLAHTRRRLALRNVGRPTQAIPDRKIWPELPSDVQPTLPMLAAFLPLSPLTRVRMLSGMLTLPNPRARLAAAEHLAVLALDTSATATSAPRTTTQGSHSRHASTELASDAIHALSHHIADQHPLIARTAWRAVHAADARDQSNANDHASAQHMHWAMQCSDGWTVDRARFQFAAHSVASYFQCWLKMPREQRFAVAHALNDRASHEMLERLLQHVQSTHRVAGMEAISILRRLGLARAAEPVLIEITHVADPFVASSAIAALSDGVSHETDRALRDSLDHGHPRVRANAVEAITRRHAGDPIVEILRPLTLERDNRVRANAIVGEANHEPHSARAMLANMLRDSDAMHRISGLWAASRVRDRSHLREIRLLAERDPVAEVRERAQRTAAQLQIVLKRQPKATSAASRSQPVAQSL